MSNCTVRNVGDLVGAFLPKNYKFVSADFKKLTSSGENYGSVLLSVDIIVENEEKEVIFAVAKKLPCNELVQKMFNTQCTFPNEVGYYKTIFPCLREFQRDQGLKKLINSCPTYYTSRILYNTDAKLADGSVLLVKNIKKEGFDILDRTVGFDLDQSRLILQKMAELHATIIALRKHKPLEFNKLQPFFQEYETFVMDQEDNTKLIQGSLAVIKTDAVCRPFLPQLEELMLRSSYLYPKKNEEMVPSNPFCTLVHSDLWTNNIMLKIVNDKTVDVKFVDYQLYEFSSLTRDVVFFVYSSVEIETLRQHCDFLFRYYHENFIKYATRLNCEEDYFSFENFMADMATMVRDYEFFHIMTMLPPIFATSKDIKEVEQLEMDSFTFHESEITPQYREKACFIVRDLVQRQWLP